MPDSVESANLGRWFPPWTVTRVAWHKALKPQVSGVPTDVMLFSESGSSLVHHYRVFGRSAAHASLHGMYMAKLRSFTVRAEAEAKWEAGLLPIQKTQIQLPAVSATLRSIRPRGSDDEAPVCKARQAVSPVIPEVSTSTASSTIVSSVTSYSGTATSYDLPAPRQRSILYGGQPPMLLVLIPLLRFANKYFVPSPVRSALVAT